MSADAQSAPGSLTFVSFGEALWDMLPDGPVLGGAPLNLAYRISELGHRAHLVSAVGKDELGERALERIEELALSNGSVQRQGELPTGSVLISFRPDGEPEYEIVAPVAYDAIVADSRWARRFGEVDCVCYGTLAQRDRRSRSALVELLATVDAGERFCDVNLRPTCYTPQTVVESLEVASIAKLNSEELEEVSQMAGIGTVNDRASGMKALMKRFSNLKVLVVTLGGEGAAALERGGNVVSAPVPAVHVVDPCGAGDAFAAAFLVSYLSRSSLLEAVEAGNRRGALVATQRGATDPIRGDAASPLHLAEPRGAADPGRANPTE